MGAVRKSGKPADKPGSVERSCDRRAVIPLDCTLPCSSSSLPGSDASHVDAPLFGLAPDGVYRAVRVTTSAVGSYPTFSPLPGLCCRRRFIFCCPCEGPRGYPRRQEPAQIDPSTRITPSGDTFRRFCLAAYGARPLAGILL